MALVAGKGGSRIAGDTVRQEIYNTDELDEV